MARALSRAEYAIAMYQANAGQQVVAQQASRPEVIDVVFREVPDNYEELLRKEVLRLLSIARNTHRHLF